MSARITIRRSSALHNQLCRDARAANLMTAAAFVFVILPIAAQAADMSTKAPVTAIYNWSGCYIGINAGAGGAGSDFTSTVGNGTHLLSADAALVSNSGTGSADATGFLGGGQTGCNWRSGLIVYGLEGDFDYFHSRPSFATMMKASMRQQPSGAKGGGGCPAPYLARAEAHDLRRDKLARALSDIAPEHAVT